MVWAMHFPSGIGPYWPDGTYEGPGSGYGMETGWTERLREDYLAQGVGPDNSPQRWEYPFRVTDKFKYELGTYRQAPDGQEVTPVLAHEPPSFYRTAKGYKEMASIIGLNSALWAVDEAVRSIVEQLDPGVHQFFPLEMRMPRKLVYPVGYFTIVVGRWLDSFSPEMSAPGTFRAFEGREPPIFQIGHDKGLAMRGAAFEGAHLWRERSISDVLFLSDELHDRLVEAGLKLPKQYRMKEV